MFSKRLMGRVRSRQRQTSPDQPEFLLTSAQFFKLLEEERMRADRAHAEFTLAVFRFSANDIHADRIQTETVLNFVTRLKNRLRATDHAGFFGKLGPCIAVILCNTDTVGASIFVNSVIEDCPTEETPTHEIFTYPTHPAELNDQNPTQGTPHKTTHEIQKSSDSDVLPTHPMETLFIKKLPLWKRGVDIVAASVGLIVLSPLLLITALLIKLTSRGPVFFRQQRDGLGGKPFSILKFRTMCIDAEARKAALRKFSEQDGPAFKLKNDPRITGIGRYLRKTCIDELPQLWNVLKGDMTLVGPRPLPTNESQQIAGWGRRRLEVTPGLTCIWQVHGKSKVSFVEWMRMDLRYIKLRTFFKDMKLVFQTLIAVILHRASQ
ncbi:MAG: sugar transferase [Planctomycetaceae bacterium]